MNANTDPLMKKKKTPENEDTTYKVQSTSNGPFMRKNGCVFHVANDDIDKDNSLIKGNKTFAHKLLNAALSMNDKCSQSDSGKKRSQMHVLDRVSRLAFPFLFTQFNVEYWIYYLREYITRSSNNLAPYQ